MAHLGAHRHPVGPFPERAGYATPRDGEQDTSQTPEPISTALNQFRAHLTEHCPDPKRFNDTSGQNMRWIADYWSCARTQYMGMLHGIHGMTGVLGFEQKSGS